MITDLNARLDFYRKGLEGLWTRNEVISNNIANASTDNFQSRDINFEKVMNEYMSKMRSEDFSPDHGRFKYNIEYKRGLPVNANGNNVNVDKEMVSLAENQMKYDLMTQALKYQLNLFNTVISESKG